MTGLVALIIGSSAYPELPASWTVRDDRTVKDAIAVTEALVQRHVDPEKIKLFLGAKELPDNVAGVVPEPLDRKVLENFLLKGLGKGKYAGDSFFFFGSSHGVSADTKPTTLLVLPDSFISGSDRVFFCLGFEALKRQLQGSPQFKNQVFCVNACRTPQEWAITSPNDISELKTLTGNRPPQKIPQAVFFSAKDLTAAPVEDVVEGYSNGFAKALVACIKEAAWPLRPGEWSGRLKQAWPATEVHDVHGNVSDVLKRLEAARYDLDRGKQRTLADKTLKRVGDLSRRGEPNFWQSTLIDLHACTADCLGMLMQRLEKTVFSAKFVIGGVNRAGRWPDRTRDIQRRKRDLIEELAYWLVEDRSITDPDALIKELFALGPGARVVYVEIDGPCLDDKDGPLVKEMVDFWRKIVDAAVRHVPSLPYLPILLIGHIDPEQPEGVATGLDTTLFYRDETLSESHERRLNRIRGDDILGWLDPIIARTDEGRVDIERELARRLGVKFIDHVDLRMEHILNVVHDQVV